MKRDAPLGELKKAMVARQAARCEMKDRSGTIGEALELGYLTLRTGSQRTGSTRHVRSLRLVILKMRALRAKNSLTLTMGKLEHQETSFEQKTNFCFDLKKKK